MNTLPSLAARFRFNEQALEKATGDFTDDDWLYRINGTSSHALWLLGHLAVSRRALLRGSGKERPPAPWEAAFTKGSRPMDGKDGPSPQALKADLVASGELLEAHLGSLTPEQAAAPYSRTMPDGSSTIDGAAHFLHWHETYHIGQLGLLRRACGKPGLA